MKKTNKIFCFLISISLLFTFLPTMGVSAAIGQNGAYCDFDDVTLRTATSEAALSSSDFSNENLAILENPGSILVSDLSSDGNKGLHLFGSAAVGVALPTAVTTGKVKVTLEINPKAVATFVYLATDMGGSLGESTTVTIGKFGNNFTLGTSGPTKAMTQNKYNRIELIVDIASGSVTGYCNGQSIGTLSGLSISTVEGVIIGGNATLENKVSNKVYVGDLGISTYVEDDTFSCVNATDSVAGGVHTTKLMFDEPIDVVTLPNASNITITPCTGETSINATSVKAYGPQVELTWSGTLKAGTEYRIDFGTGFKSIYARPLDDGAYLIEEITTATTTLIDENFNSLSTQTLDVKTGFNTATGIYLLGGDSHEVTSDVAQTVANAEALCFSKSDDETYDEPRYLKMPRSDAAYPYGTDPYTAANGDYAAVPYQNCDSKASKELYYKVGDLTKTELGGMPATGIVRWSFDYLWEQGSGTSALSTNYYLKWGGEEIIGWSGTPLNQLLFNASNNTNTWNSVVVEYDASNKKVRYAATEAKLGAWTNADMSTCDWLVLPAELSVPRLSFAIDNVKVTWTNTPVYVEGVRYVGRDGSVTGATSVGAETEAVKIYFSAPMASDIASHIKINGAAVSASSLSADGKVLTVGTGLFKGNSSVQIGIDANAASAEGAKISGAKAYTIKTGAGRFALEGFAAEVNASTEGTITQGDTVTVNADIVNTVGQKDGCTLIFAYYKDNGLTLVDVGIHNVDLSDTTYWKEVRHTFTPTAVGKTYDSVKVFAWNSLTGATPLVGSITK